ncbi:MAG: 4-hydroxythreonine-4-phosphate dehydrogenase PdxA [Endomicrobia bacterium]|nr:4-hydroxythreonine-4-phosphate dehydrogenase PdxA [Endomicrobiia bacterium]MCL2506976.1 4-hydroxythreonine-4-phosphate dehydrogenase PdxA [Endomicrobiia bacterium]
MTVKPRIAITLGDLAGIGSEIVFRAVNSLEVQRVCSPVIFGDKTAINNLQITNNKEMTSLRGEAKSRRGNPGPTSHYDFITTSDIGKIALGKPSKKSGIAAYNAIKTASQFCLDGKADALVTAPVSKESLKLAGVKHPGHTELLAALTKSRNIAMIMACGKILSVMVTRHIPLNQVSKKLKSKDIIETVKLTVKFLSKIEELRVKSKDTAMNITLRSPLSTLSLKVALCSLNPHAGDNGILGDEEQKIIYPAYKALKKMKINVSVPMPADSAWLKTKNGEYDLICGMYHDQIMVPLKCIDAKKIVNVTAGLPFVRTSPGHGTAFDIAGKGKADPSAMIEAILFAAKAEKKMMRCLEVE